MRDNRDWISWKSRGYIPRHKEKGAVEALQQLLHPLDRCGRPRRGPNGDSDQHRRVHDRPRHQSVHLRFYLANSGNLSVRRHAKRRHAGRGAPPEHHQTAAHSNLKANEPGHHRGHLGEQLPAGIPPAGLHLQGDRQRHVRPGMVVRADEEDPHHLHERGNLFAHDGGDDIVLDHSEENQESLAAQQQRRRHGEEEQKPIDFAGPLDGDELDIGDAPRRVHAVNNLRSRRHPITLVVRDWHFVLLFLGHKPTPCLDHEQGLSFPVAEAHATEVSRRKRKESTRDGNPKSESRRRGRQLSSW